MVYSLKLQRDKCPLSATQMAVFHSSTCGAFMLHLAKFGTFVVPCATWAYPWFKKWMGWFMASTRTASV